MSENRIAIYVPMPLNSSGDGPADLNETVRVEHQVWDAETNLTMFTARDETTALAVVEAWNRRTPAPEGEACPHDAYETDAAGQPVRCVDCGMAIASAASPVVPAPEGEAVATVGLHCYLLWTDAGVRANLPTGTPLYASPVVPVGVSREEIARIIDPAAFLFGPGELEDKVYSSSRAHAFDRADAIIAALRPTDTGRE
jgi:hypothetical protein